MLQMDLLVDGNIAHMFSPEGAARYFGRLLGVDPRSLQPTSLQAWPRTFFITNPAVQNARPSLAINGQPLDFVISEAGTVVPQRMWSSANPTDAQRFGTVSLNMPVYFSHNDRITLGLPLPRAIEGGNRAILLGAGGAAPIGNCSTMYIRICVRTFSPQSCTAHNFHIFFPPVARLQ
jgi:hypothetical protein